MKFFRNCLMGMLVFFCLFGSCSTGETDPKDLSTEEETSQDQSSQEEDKTTPDGDKLSGKENPDETQDETQDEAQDENEEIPPMPEFVSHKVVSETEITFKFSQPVVLETLDLSPLLEFDVVEEGNEIKILLTEAPAPGLLVEADLQVKDEYDNAVNKKISFRTRNGHVPDLQINELRTEYSNPKAEFIEFKILKDGNMGALRVFVAGNNKKPVLYEFAPVEVKTGEYVVLHLRKPEGSCKDENGKSLNESDGKDSCPTARDLWIPGSDKLLHKTDAVYVLDQDDKVLDAVMLAEKSDPLWGKDYFTQAADFLFSQGAWKSAAGTVCSPADAVNSSKATLTRSICRDETAINTHKAADWYVTVNNGATPGEKNNINRY